MAEILNPSTAAAAKRQNEFLLVALGSRRAAPDLANQLSTHSCY